MASSLDSQRGERATPAKHLGRMLNHRAQFVAEKDSSSGQILLNTEEYRLWLPLFLRSDWCFLLSRPVIPSLAVTSSRGVGASVSFIFSPLSVASPAASGHCSSWGGFIPVCFRSHLRGWAGSGGTPVSTTAQALWRRTLLGMFSFVGSLCILINSGETDM